MKAIQQRLDSLTCMTAALCYGTRVRYTLEQAAGKLRLVATPQAMSRWYTQSVRTFEADTLEGIEQHIDRLHEGYQRRLGALTEYSALRMRG